MKKIVVIGSTGAAGTEVVNMLNAIDTYIVETPSQEEYWAPDYLTIANADAVVICLPEDRANAWLYLRDIPSNTVIIDCGYGSRFNSEWTYGYLYNPKNIPKFRESKRVANPGCFATGMQLLLNPLIEQAWWPKSLPLALTGITGYSTGGRASISKQNMQPLMSRHANVSAAHGHVKEVQRALNITNPILLDTNIVNLYQGQSVLWQIHQSQLAPEVKEWTASQWKSLLSTYYSQYPEINVKIAESNSLILDSVFNDLSNVKNNIEVQFIVSVIEDWLRVEILYDNLGVGASGNIIKVLNRIFEH